MLAKLKEKQNLILFGLVILTILLRIPSLFEPYWHGDEGIYFTVGKRIFAGDLLYRDVYDNKPPIIYLIFGGLQTIFNVRLIATFWVIGTLVILYKLSIELAQSLKLRPLVFAAATGLVFSLLASTPTIEANTSNGELWFILPTTAAMYLIFSHLQKRLPNWELVLAGVLFSAATLIKVPAICDFAAAILILLIASKKLSQKLINDWLLLAAGFVLPWILTSLFFLTKSSFGFFFKATFTDTSSYVDYENKFLIPQGLLIIKGLLTLAVSGVVYLLSQKIKIAKVFIFVWLIFSILGSLIGGRNYTHYVIQTLPAFSLLIGLLAVEILSALKSKNYSRVVLSLIFLIAAKIIFEWVNFPTFQVKNYYQNFIDFKLGKKDYVDYIRSFDWRTERLETISTYLKSNLKTNQAIYVWGNEPDIYHLSNAKPATRYVTAYHVFSVPGAKDYVLSTLNQNPPTYVVSVNDLPDKLNEMDTFLSTRYLKVFEVENANILKLRTINQ